jgi:hypothetical protein
MVWDGSFSGLAAQGLEPADYRQAALGFLQSALIRPLKEDDLMAKKKSGVNKSEAIRQLLRAHPEMPVKEIVSTLAAKGIKVADTLVYYIKGKLIGRKGRRKKARQMVLKVATATSNGNPVATILKVKGWAAELGGLKKLKALVDVLIE